MKEFIDSPLLGNLAKALAVDINSVTAPAKYPCRPLAAETAGGRTVLGRFLGPIGLPVRQDFKNALDDLVTDSAQKVILDLAETSLSKSALGVLLSFTAQVVGRNSRLYLYRPSAQIRSALKELGLTAFFSYLETEEDLIATLVI